jgi:D-glycero-alpha-D-manno-heptose-7-phosphate kinase
MLLVRTPLRISIGGGGTDLPSYYRDFGGFVISAAINKYVFIGINRIFSDDYVLKYSSQERVKCISEIEHPILREALQRHSVQPGVEIVSLADIPAGTGLGSSGSFTVGLMRALYALQREPVSNQEVAEEACHIEMNLLKGSGGKQDQYAAAYGGLICMDYQKSGTVEVSRLKICNDTITHLEEHLAMFFTGYSRSAETLLSDQRKRTEKKDEQVIESLHFTKQLGHSIREALEAGEVHKFGELMHQHWLHKRSRSEGMSNPCIDSWYEVGLANGATGGKLIGAGGGGFLLFYANDRPALRRAMAAQGLQEVRFQFDHDGSTVMMRD